jgi:hypothetical protein
MCCRILANDEVNRSNIHMRKQLFSWGFMALALVLGAWATHAVGYDETKAVLYFLVPYYTIAAAMQYIWPHSPNKFEPNEVITDWLNNAGLLVVTLLQAYMVRWMEREGTGLLFEHGWLSTIGLLATCLFGRKLWWRCWCLTSCSMSRIALRTMLISSGVFIAFTTVRTV